MCNVPNGKHQVHNKVFRNDLIIEKGKLKYIHSIKRDILMKNAEYKDKTATLKNAYDNMSLSGEKTKAHNYIRITTTFKTK